MILDLSKKGVTKRVVSSTFVHYINKFYCRCRRKSGKSARNLKGSWRKTTKKLKKPKRNW